MYENPIANDPFARHRYFIYFADEEGNCIIIMAFVVYIHFFLVYDVISFCRISYMLIFSLNSHQYHV